MLFQRYSKCQDQICFETSWASLGTKEGEFNQTSGVAVKSSGNVYVVDERNDRIQKFTSDGKYISVDHMEKVGVI